MGVARPYSKHAQPSKSPPDGPPKKNNSNKRSNNRTHLCILSGFPDFDTRRLQCAEPSCLRGRGGETGAVFPQRCAAMRFEQGDRTTPRMGRCADQQAASADTPGEASMAQACVCVHEEHLRLRFMRRSFIKFLHSRRNTGHEDTDLPASGQNTK